MSIRPVLLARISAVALVALISAGMTPSDALAEGQSRLEVISGVILVNSSDIVEGSNTGWVVGGGWNITKSLGLEIQLDRLDWSQTVTFLDVNAKFVTLLAGPKFVWRRPFMQPFGRVLVGTTKIVINVNSELPFSWTGKSEETHRTIQLSGGVDVPVTRRLWARITYDYRRVFAVEALHQHGMSASAVYGFGGS